MLLAIASFYVGLVPKVALAINVSQKTEFELQTQHRIFNSDSSTRETSMTDQYFIGRTTFQFDPSPSYGVEFQPELRALYTRGRELSATDPAALDLPEADRLVPRELMYVVRDDFVATLNIERLNASYRFNEGSFLVGRRAVTLGNFRTLVILNKFSAAPLQSVGYPFYFGQDGATWTYGGAVHQFRAISILGERRERDAHLLEWKVGGNGFELQALGGKWWNRMAYGFAPTLDVGGGSLRLEVLTVPDDEMTQAGLGFERALGESFKFIFESLYQNLGARDASEITLASPSPYMIFRSRMIGLGQLEYAGLSYWNFSLGLARSFSDGSLIGAFRTQYSVSDYCDVYFDSRVPITESQGEFSTYSLSLPGGRSVGQNTYASLGLKIFF